MATTPNYGWVTPAPTDLVTDLPADFETFADAVDADLAGLLGGTTGQVLTKNSATDHDYDFATIPAAGLVKITTVTFTTSAAVNVDNVFSATYANYLIISDFVGSTTADGLLRMRVAGSDTSSANYNTQNLFGAGSTASANRVTSGTSFRVCDASAEQNGSVMHIINPNLAVKTMMFNYGLFNGAGSIEVQNKVGVLQLTTSYTGFTFFPSTGTVTGTIRVYGLAN